MSNSPDSVKGFNYLYGLINLAVIFCIVWVLWFVFMHADGVMKLYTPMYGFSLVAILLASVILLGRVLGWPSDPEQALPAGRAIGQGILGVVLSLAIMYVIYYWGSGCSSASLAWPISALMALVAGGGTGAEPWNAREWSSTAILYFGTAFLWWALVWNLGFGRWPWQNDSRWVVGWSRLFVVSFFSIVTFAVLFHPHVCMLFPEAQKMAGAKPWWEVWASTNSAFFSLGVVLCTLFWVVFSDLFWEGRPWSWLERGGEANLAKGIITVLGTLFLGLVLVYILTAIFNAIWMEPYQGGQYTDGPDWRFIHMGEVSGFCVLFAFIWKYYFNNWPNGLPLLLRAIIRSLIGVAGGMLIYWFYYSPLAVVVLGKVPGRAQPDDQPLVWTLLFLAVLLMQVQFFHNWPLRRAGSQDN